MLYSQCQRDNTMKKYLILTCNLTVWSFLIFQLTMCATPTPAAAQHKWPHQEKQNFISECFNQINKDGSLKTTFTNEMLLRICECAATEWEKEVDWKTFGEITKPPLQEDVEKKFFITSYQCALDIIQEFRV